MAERKKAKKKASNSKDSGKSEGDFKPVKSTRRKTSGKDPAKTNDEKFEAKISEEKRKRQERERILNSVGSHIGKDPNEMSLYELKQAADEESFAGENDIAASLYQKYSQKDPNNNAHAVAEAVNLRTDQKEALSDIRDFFSRKNNLPDAVDSQVRIAEELIKAGGGDLKPLKAYNKALSEYLKKVPDEPLRENQFKDIPKKDLHKKRGDIYFNEVKEILDSEEPKNSQPGILNPRIKGAIDEYAKANDAKNLKDLGDFLFNKPKEKGREFKESDSYYDAADAYEALARISGDEDIFNEIYRALGDKFIEASQNHENPSGMILLATKYYEKGGVQESHDVERLKKLKESKEKIQERPHEGRNDYEETMKQIDGSLWVASSNPEKAASSYEAKVKTYEFLGDTEKAQEELEEMANYVKNNYEESNVRGENNDPWQTLSESYEKLGKTEKAQEIKEKANKLGESYEE